METYALFGLKVNNLSLDESLEKIDSLIKSGGTHLIVTLGVEMVNYAEKDREFFDIVNQASLVVPDSVGILWACKKAGHVLKERVPGIDILYAAAKRREEYPWKIFFLGAKPGVAEAAAKKLEEDYPGINIAGVHHGYFKDDLEVLEKIKSTSPDIIFIAMGFPAQEKWFVKNAGKIGRAVAIGIGGSFDVVSGNLKRAPGFFRKLGLEWLYRLICQPSRIGRMMALPAFALRVLLKGEKQ